MGKLAQKRGVALVLGLGLSGCSAARYLSDRGWQVVGVDRSGSKVERVKSALRWRSLLLESQSSAIDQVLPDCQQVVVSPGIDLRHTLIAKIRQLNIPLIGELQLGLEALSCEGRRAIVAISGSNGKTTVARWLEHVLRACGRSAIAVGNVGLPLTSCIAQARKGIVIVEISSFQLETLQGVHFDLAALLNITPNHLDRHESLDHYAQLKCGLQQHCENQELFFTSSTVAREFAGYLKAPVCTFGTNSADQVFFDCGRVRVGSDVICASAFLGNRWNSKAANFCAVLALASRLGLSPADVCRSAGTFRPPPHRLEWVGTHRGLEYFNDSKATSLEAVKSAVGDLGGSILLIAGGVHKGASYSPWIKAFAGRVRCILAIGQAACQIERELKRDIEVYRCSTLPEAVFHASSLGRPGEKILLSPGCSSFDMFENYEQRGREFIALVEQITGEVHQK